MRIIFVFIFFFVIFVEEVSTKDLLPRGVHPQRII